MGILDKILGHDKQTQPDAAPPMPETEAAECPHTALAPHWDSLGDMGKKELATYTCESCGRTFSYEQAEVIMNQPPAVVLAAGHAPAPYDDEARS